MVRYNSQWDRRRLNKPGFYYIRREWVNDIREQIEVYKRFRNLIEKWIDLFIGLDRKSIFKGVVYESNNKYRS